MWLVIPHFLSGKVAKLLDQENPVDMFLDFIMALDRELSCQQVLKICTDDSTIK